MLSLFVSCDAFMFASTEVLPSPLAPLAPLLPSLFWLLLPLLFNVLSTGSIISTSTILTRLHAMAFIEDTPSFLLFKNDLEQLMNLYGSWSKLPPSPWNVWTFIMILPSAS